MIKHRGKGPVVAVLTALWGLAPGLPAVTVADDVSLNVTPGSEFVMPGDTVTATLDVANLSEPINGVQTLIHYDDTILSLVSIVPMDLQLQFPDEGWVEVFLADFNGDVDYAAVINGDSTFPFSMVATLTFDVIGEGTTTITFRLDAGPVVTKLTTAADNATIMPTKAGSGDITSACDDGLWCNGLETLVGGSCQAGTPPDCSPLTDQCNDGVCNEGIGACEAQPVNEGGGCNDSDSCTVGDVCTSGECAGLALDCSGLDDACNVGTCNQASGLCEAAPANEGGSCDDLAFCNGLDTCSSGVCISAGDPCAPLVCDEVNDVCLAPINVANIEVFYGGKLFVCHGGSNDGGACIADFECPVGVCWEQGDPGTSVLATGSAATIDNVTNDASGITGIRITFNDVVTFATTPEAAFVFEWTTGAGGTFSAVTNPASAITVTPVVYGGATVAIIDLADDYIRRRWLKVTIDSTQVTAGGVELDGELSGNPVPLPSGDGNAGGNAVFYLGNIPGDVNGDRKTGLTDVGLIRAVVNPFLVVPITDSNDVDKSGKIQLTDVGLSRLDVNPFFTLPLITP